jgi:hypothetical protein
MREDEGLRYDFRFTISIRISISDAESFQDLGLRGPHTGLFTGPGVVEAQQMQGPVDGQQLDFGLQRVTCRTGLNIRARDRDEDITQITAGSFRVRFGGGEGEHIGRRIDAQVLPVKRVQLRIVRQQDGQVAILRLVFEHGQRSAVE